MIIERTSSCLTSRLFQVVSILLFVNFLSACQIPPLNVHARTAEGVSLQAYHSVAVEALEEDGKIITMLTQGIEHELINKGYVLSDEPDLVFIYRLDLKEGDQLRQNILPSGTSTYTKMEIEAVYEASMLVNAIDTKTKQVVWKASTTRDIRGVKKKNIDQHRIDQRMSELFESFTEK